MNIEETGIPGLVVVTPARFRDERGVFSETWNRSRLAEHGITTDFVQDNHSISTRPGTVRGLHFQAPPHAQAKLVRCGRGALFDVAVDLRRNSPTYGRWFGIELDAEIGRQLMIPAGFAHGFVTRLADTEIVYKCSAHYAPETEGSIRFDDPDLAIDWGLGGLEPLLSARDDAAQAFAGFESPFVYDGDAA